MERRLALVLRSFSEGGCEAEGSPPLEGSRLSAFPVTPIFWACRDLGPENVKAGGSRELPIAWLLCTFAKVNLLCGGTTGLKIALGRSREPPVAARFGYTNDRNNEPGLRTQAKAARLQGGDPFGLASPFAKASEDKSEAALHARLTPETGHRKSRPALSLLLPKAGPTAGGC